MKDNLIAKFCKALQNLKIEPTDKILVAISGGADSLALAHLFYAVNQPIALAHCNFNLRGEASDQDEEFVKEFAENHQIPIYNISFETEKIAKERGVSIEMAARDLRYDWFKTICNEHNYDFTATGHHENDSVETFFLNLNRGSGIKGLIGIKEANKNVVRPLIGFSRDEIELYLKLNDLEFRTDASNFENHYLRNKFRNLVIPELNKINPQFSTKILESMSHLKQVYESFKIRVEEVKDQILISDGERTMISQTLVEKLPDKEIIMYEILLEYGFNKSQTTNILSFNTGQCGQQFFSPSHRLIKDRHNYILLTKRGTEEAVFYYNYHEELEDAPIRLKFSEIDVSMFEINRNPNIAQFDAEMIDFPLTLRHWQHGDSFKPLGMNGFKKVSDFFIDLKFSQDQKESCWLLISADEIIWVIDHRIDDRFKVTPKTKKVLIIELQ